MRLAEELLSRGNRKRERLIQAAQLILFSNAAMGLLVIENAKCGILKAISP